MKDPTAGFPGDQDSENEDGSFEGEEEESEDVEDEEEGIHEYEEEGDHQMNEEGRETDSQRWVPKASTISEELREREERRAGKRPMEEPPSRKRK